MGFARVYNLVARKTVCEAARSLTSSSWQVFKHSFTCSSINSVTYKSESSLAKNALDWKAGLSLTRACYVFYTMSEFKQCREIKELSHYPFSCQTKVGFVKMNMFKAFHSCKPLKHLIQVWKQNLSTFHFVFLSLHFCFLQVFFGMKKMLKIVYFTNGIFFMDLYFWPNESSEFALMRRRKRNGNEKFTDPSWFSN